MICSQEVRRAWVRACVFFKVQWNRYAINHEVHLQQHSTKFIVKLSGFVITVAVAVTVKNNHGK
jgi:hypothetical protein